MDNDNQPSVDEIEHQSASPQPEEENLMSKLTSLEQDVKNIQLKLASAMRHAPEISNEGLKKENEILKRDVDQLHMNLVELQEKEKYYLEKMEAFQEELNDKESITEPPRKEENLFDPKLTVQSLKQTVESLQEENSDLKRKIRSRDTLIRKLKDQLVAEKNRHEGELKVVRLNQQRNNVERWENKLESPKKKLERLRSKSPDPQKPFTPEQVVEQLVKVDALMNAGDVVSAANTCGSLFLANPCDQKIIDTFNKVTEIQRCLTIIDEELSHYNSAVNKIESTFNEFKNLANYPKLVKEMERKMLDFYFQRRCTKQALNMCMSYLSKGDCRDASVYYKYGDLLLTKPDFRGAREAYGFSLRYSKESDPDLDAIYDKASEVLKAEISRNPWTLFNPSGDTLPLPALQVKYNGLTEYFRPDKQSRYVNQYQDFARLMTHYLTKVYNALGVL